LYCPIQWKNYYVNQLYTVIFYWLWVSWLTIKHLFVCLFFCVTFHYISMHKNRIGGVMVSMLSSSFYWLYCSLWASWLTITYLFVCLFFCVTFHYTCISMHKMVLWLACVPRVFIFVFYRPILIFYYCYVAIETSEYRTVTEPLRNLKLNCFS
jgi:hypothetical protein